MSLVAVLVEALILASSGLISVGSILIVILLLISERGLKNGIGYVAGYIFGYSLISTGMILLQQRTANQGGSSSNMTFNYISIFFGLVLLYLAFKNFRKQPDLEKKEDPKLFRILDGITPVKAFSLGLVVTILNFKNLALFLTSISVVAFSGLSISEKIFAAVLVIIVFTISVMTPVFIYLLFPTRGREILETIRDALKRHSRPISIWGPLIFGVILLFRGGMAIL
ncbi:MAG: hypothetical protein D6732_23975 [Methanobacteriota archaeon]|nr:MAG: hypothetical protein D6732_23975 [Euryarchaeota archaeon]